MRYVFIRQHVGENRLLGVSAGTIVYVARLRADVALSSALGAALGAPITSVTDPRVEWAKTAGKCNVGCKALPPSLGLAACGCAAMTQARLMLREIDRKVTA